MAGQPSTVGAGIGLDAKTGRATQTARTTYLAFLTAAPTDATTMGTMAEITTAGTNGYARPSVTWSAPAGDPAETHNTNELLSGDLAIDVSPCTHVALVSAVTGTSGDFIFFWTLDSSRDPATGDELRVAASALSMTDD